MSAPTPTQRALLVFHEGHGSGASMALLRLAPELRARGWTLDSVFAGGGKLIPHARQELASVEVLEQPTAFTLPNWRRPLETVGALRALLPYVRSFVRVLRERNPQVIHCNTLVSLPEAIIGRALGFPVIAHVHELPASGLRRSLAVAALQSCADALIAVSSAVEDSLVHGRLRTPVIVARSGVPKVSPYPRATLEAMRGGLPIVPSRVGGTPEQITHYAPGVVARLDNPEDLAQAITRLADDQDLRRRLDRDAQRESPAVSPLESQAAAVELAYQVALRNRFAPRPLRRSESRA